MSLTTAQLINEVQGQLQGYSLDESQSTTLSGTLSPTALTFAVTDVRGVAVGVSPGILEIDQELIYCASVDSSGNAIIPPWGRGYAGTTAATHAAGSRIISQPTFPRFWTLRAINETLSRVYPEVFAVRQVELVTTTSQFTYSLPSDAERVLRAAWQEPGPARYWRTISRTRMSPGLGTMFGDTGKSVDVGDTMMAGRPIQFVYAARPGLLVNEADDFEATTGLGPGLIDVVSLGAQASLTASQELSRLQMSSVEQQNRSQLVAPSAALTSSRYLDQRFNERLQEERKSLQQLYPPRITGVWL